MTDDGMGTRETLHRGKKSHKDQENNSNSFARHRKRKSSRNSNEERSMMYSNNNNQNIVQEERMAPTNGSKTMETPRKQNDGKISNQGDNSRGTPVSREIWVRDSDGNPKKLS
jgi:hypothetical protein